MSNRPDAWRSPNINDWWCAEHNMPLALLRGLAACTLYAEHSYNGNSAQDVNPWIDAQNVRMMESDRSSMYRVLPEYNTVLRNRMVPRKYMTDEDHAVEKHLRRLATPPRRYWHVFYRADLGTRIVGSTYADADSVNPTGDRPLNLGIARAPGDPHDEDVKPWVAGWYSTDPKSSGPSRALVQATVDVWRHDQVGARKVAIRERLVEEEVRSGTTPIR